MTRPPPENSKKLSFHQLLEQNSSSNEKNEFREAIAGAKPLKQDRHPPTRPPPPLLNQRAADDAAIIAGDYYDSIPMGDLETGEEIVFRNHLPEKLWRKLRRGQFRLEATLDLHGLTVEQAYQTCRQFLQQQQRDDLRCVRVIHGKGYHSTQGARLKNAVAHWLPQWSVVLACCPAREADGGSGAVYVLLRKKKS